MSQSILFITIWVRIALYVAMVENAIFYDIQRGYRASNNTLPVGSRYMAGCALECSSTPQCVGFNSGHTDDSLCELVFEVQPAVGAAGWDFGFRGRN